MVVLTECWDILMIERTLSILLIDADQGDAEITRLYLDKIQDFPVDFQHVTDVDSPEVASFPSDQGMIIVSCPSAAENGPDIVQSFREAGRVQPIVTLIDRDDDQLRMSLLANGADVTLLKDEINANQLCEAIIEATARSERRIQKRTLKILAIEDNPADAELLRRNLENVSGFRIHFQHVLDPDDPQTDVYHQEADLTFIDYHLGKKCGLDVLESFRKSGDLKPIVIMTGHGDTYLATRLMRCGADDYLAKQDVNPERLSHTIVDALQHAQRRMSERDIHEHIAQFDSDHGKVGLIRPREEDLLQQTFKGAIALLNNLVALSHPEAPQRAFRISKLVGKIAEQMEIKQTWELKLAATLSQVGYIGVPETILKRYLARTPLTEEEHWIYLRHAKMGHDLIAKIPRLKDVAEIVLYQQKHYSGGGFPVDDRRGEEIPLASRILRVASEYDHWYDGKRAQREVVGRLRSISNCDPKIIDSLEFALRLRQPPQSKTKPPRNQRQQPAQQTRLVRWRELVPGMVLAEDFPPGNHVATLIAQGQELTDTLLAKLEKHRDQLQESDCVEIIEDDYLPTAGELSLVQSS